MAEIKKEDCYTDKTIMMFGKHTGKRLDEVPASYLLWLKDLYQIDIDKNKSLWDYERKLYDYIMDNEQVLNKEANEERFKGYKPVR